MPRFVRGVLPLLAAWCLSSDAVAHAGVNQARTAAEPTTPQAAADAATYDNITSGVPVSGSVPRLGEAFFRLDAPFAGGLPRAVAVLTSTSGACELYATAGYYYDPEPYNHEWSGTPAFGESLLVVPANASFADVGRQCAGAPWSVNTTECPLNFGVFGSRGCNFTLSVTLPGAEAALAPGAALAGALSGPSPDFYNVSLVGDESSLTLRVTPAAGAAGLRAQLFAGGSAAACAAADEPPGLGAIALALTSASPCFAAAAAAGGALVAAVSTPSAPAGAATLYAVTLTTSSAPLTSLLDGVPAPGGGPDGQVDGFAFAVPAGLAASGGAGASVRVAVAAAFGGVALYAALGPLSPSGALPGPAGGRSDFVASSPSSGSPLLLSVPAASAAWAAAGCDAGCALTLAAYTTTPVSSFLLTASAAQWTWLDAALPAPGALPPAAASPALFAFAALPPATAPLLFSVDATAGRAVLAVACAPANATGGLRPDPADNRTFAWWAGGEGDGAVEVVVSPADAAACAPPAVYALGVASGDAARGTAFAVVARALAGGGAPSPISLDAPVADAVAAGGAPNLYVLALDNSAAAVTVSVTAAGGDGGTAPPLALYGAVGAAAANLSSPTDAAVSYVADAPTGEGADQTFVVRAATDARYNASGCAVPGGVCFLTIAVAGLASPPTTVQAFTLSAGADARVLTDGVPLLARVGAAPAVAAFSFLAADASPFVLALTPLAGGGGTSPPDLFLARGYAPNASAWGWESRGVGYDVLRVTWREPFNSPAGVAFPVRFHVLVAGYDAPSAFSLLYQSVAYTVLAPGVPATLFAEPGVLTYALLQAPQPSADGGAVVGFELSSVALSGDAAPAVFVNVVTATRSCAHCGYPTCVAPPCDADDVTNVYPPWSSAGAADARAIAVEPSDPFFTPGGLYVVAILPNAESAVSVTATLTDGVALLSDGVPLPWSMAGGAANDTYARFLVTIVARDVTLDVAVSPTAGEVDLFVSVNASNPRPTAAAFDKAALGGAAGGGGLVVRFAWPELPECPDSSVAGAILCYAWIAVRVRARAGGADFTVLADAAKRNNTAAQLVPGVPQVGALAAAETALYYGVIDVAPGVPFSVLLNPHGVVKAFAYATTDGSRPSATNPAAAATSGTNGPRAIVFAPGAPGYNASCLLRVAVEVPWSPSGGYQSFDVTLVIGSDGLTELLPGVPARVEVQVLHTRYFSFALADAPAAAAKLGGVQFFVSAASGPPVGPAIALGVTTAGNASFLPGPGGAPTCAAASGDAARAWALTVDPAAAAGGGGGCACPEGGAGCRFVLAVSCPGVPYIQPACILLVAATLGSPAPLALSDGVVVTEPLPPPPAPAFFYFDVTALAAGGNVSVSAWSASGAALRLRAAACGAWADPTPQPDYDSAATGAPGAYAAISASSLDAALARCAPAGCPLLCVALTSDGGGGGTAGVVAIVSGGVPRVLTLGVAAPVALGLYRQSLRYALWTASSAQDLTITVTALTGSAVFTLDAGAGADCAIARPSGVVSCRGTWASTDGSALVVRAADPCAGANAGAAAPCDAARDWSSHGDAPYILSVLVTLSPSAFIVLAAQPGVAVALAYGEPAASTASGAAPALFYALVDGDGSDVRILASAGAVGLAWAAAGCDGADAGGAAQPCAAATPPAPPAAAGAIAPHAAAPLPAVAWCPGAKSCRVFVRVRAAPACEAAPSCAAPVTLLARSAKGGAPVDVPWAAVASQAAELLGDAPLSLAQVFLPGLAGAGSAGVDVALSLDSCGAGVDAPPAALFFCDLSAPVGAGACAAPFAPGEGDATGAAVAAPVAALVRAGTTAPALYVAARGGGGWPADGAGSPSFVLRVAAAPRGAPLPLVLVAPGGVALAPAAPAASRGGSVSVTWPAAAVAPPAGLPGSAAVAPAPAASVNYTVYVSSAGGFASACAALRVVAEPRTACGLARAAADCGGVAVFAAPALDALAMTLPVPTAPPGGAAYAFDVAVAASCDAACWGATPPPAGAATPADARTLSAAYARVTVSVPAAGGGGGGGRGGGAAAGAQAGLAAGAAVASLAAAAALAAVAHRALRARGGLAALLPGGGGGARAPRGFARVGAADDDAEGAAARGRPSRVSQLQALLSAGAARERREQALLPGGGGEEAGDA